MYIVASTWQVLHGQIDEAERRGSEMRRRMLTMPGIEQIIAFHTSDSDVMVVVAYADEATYDKIVNDPNGPFVKNAAELKLEELMEWKQSWRGTTMD